MVSHKRIRLAVSLIAFIAVVAPFMYLLSIENSEEAFKQNSGWLIKYTLFWMVLMSLLLIRNPRWFGDETPFDILLRKSKQAIDWLRVK